MIAAGPLCFALYCAILVYCHRHETDGRIHPSRVKSLLDFSAVEIDIANPTARPFGPTSHGGDTGADPIQIADALVEAGLLESVGGWYVVHDYLKHNNSHAEREAIRAKLKQGGQKGAQRRWGHSSPDSHTYKEGDRPPDSPSHGVADGVTGSPPMPKGEGRREKGEFKAPPVPPARRPDAKANGYDDATTELAVGMQELLGRALSTIEILECQGALNQYAYLTVKDLLDRAREHQEYCDTHDLAMKRTVSGFSDSWRRENEHRADTGQPKASRVHLGRTAGATKLSDLLPSPPAKEAQA